MPSPAAARPAPRRPFDHAKNLAGRPVTPKLLIDAAWGLLAPNARRDDLANILFDGRVAPFTVKAWRIGMRAMPSWAYDLIQAKMQASAARYVEVANAAAARPMGRKAGHNIHDLRAYHMRQAAIRNGPADPSPSEEP